MSLKQIKPVTNCLFRKGDYALSLQHRPLPYPTPQNNSELFRLLAGVAALSFAHQVSAEAPSVVSNDSAVDAATAPTPPGLTFSCK